MTSLSSVPRLLRLDMAKQWTSSGIRWSPRDLLGNQEFFSPSLSLTVKHSSTCRFFMYEEHGNNKLKDDKITQLIQKSPIELADLLHTTDSGAGYCYWTSPIADVAPSLLQHPALAGCHSLHAQPELLDPRGPSLWMGTAKTATQAHYDVADNVLVQLHGTKRIRCFPPSAAPAFHVFPDAHPRARKSQVNLDTPDLKTFPLFSSLPHPTLDVELHPGDVLSIPAFWFHHVENGPSDDRPTVSLNLFALSQSMMTAQRIFRQASRPLPNAHPLAALKVLSDNLFEALHMDAQPFLRHQLLDARYVPLGYNDDNNDALLSNTSTHPLALSPADRERVTDCILAILPGLAALREEDNGVLELVLAHLLELWAVEMVGAANVAAAWEMVLQMDGTD